MGVQDPNQQYTTGEMQRTKVSTSSSASRLASAVPKALWKSRAKSQTRMPSSGSGNSRCSWTPQGECQWKALSGHRLTLLPTTLLALTEIERVALQQLALAKLQSRNIGCRVEIPKEDPTACKKVKRRAVLLRKRAVTTSYLETETANKDIPSEGLVFGIPLSQCIENDRLNRQRVPSLLRERKSEPIPPMGPMAGNSHSTEDMSRIPRSESLGDALQGEQRTAWAQEDQYRLRELLHLRKPSAVELGRLEALQGSSGSSGTTWNRGLFDCSPQVPYVVNACFKHIETYGLNMLGIFRVSTSKKRIRQLREDFDSGKDVKLNEDHHPHDVAQLLKEFFRDMPEPLLTRQLYQPFLATLKISNLVQRLEMLKLLVRLLPVPNRDTLWALTHFLAKVADYATDRKSKTGELLSGNKMDAHNLATLFGPNILRMTRTGKDVEFLVETAKRAEERCDVILVVRSLIENYSRLFEVLAEDMDAIYRKLLVEDPETLDVLLRHRFYTALESQIGISSSDRSATSASESSSSISDQQQCLLRGHRSCRDSIERQIPSISISAEATYPQPLIVADDRSSIDSDEYLLVVSTSTKGYEHLSIPDLPPLHQSRSQSFTGTDLLWPTHDEGRLSVPHSEDGKRHPSRSPSASSIGSFGIEKSASTSVLQSMFTSKSKKSESKKKQQESSSKTRQRSPFPLSKSRSNVDEHRGSVASAVSSGGSKQASPSSILVSERTSRQRTRQQGSVHFSQERWKRREIIASEYTEEAN